jgi:hypothetical protein
MIVTDLSEIIQIMVVFSVRPAAANSSRIILYTAPGLQDDDL